MSKAATVRVFEIKANGGLVHLFGEEQVFELIGLLGQALRDGREVEAKPPFGNSSIELSWARRYEQDPVAMECGSKRLTIRQAKALNGTRS